MIRKAIIVLLTLVAAVTGALALLATSGLRGGITVGSTEVGRDRISIGYVEHRVIVNLRTYPRTPTLKGVTQHRCLFWDHWATPAVFRSQDCEMWFLSLPFWVVLVPSLALGCYPTIAFIRGPIRRRRRHKRGECVACGYDLTGNVSGICSECGKPVEKQRAADFWDMLTQSSPVYPLLAWVPGLVLVILSVGPVIADLVRLTM